jgi:hypothetical protein
MCGISERGGTADPSTSLRSAQDDTFIVETDATLIAPRMAIERKLGLARVEHSFPIGGTSGYTHPLQN